MDLNNLESILMEEQLHVVKTWNPTDLKQFNSVGRNAVYFAASNPDPNVLEYLVFELGIEADKPSNVDITPLLRAAHAGRLSNILFLINFGACLEARDCLDRNCIEILEQRGFIDLVPQVLHAIDQRKKRIVKPSSNTLIKRTKIKPKD